MRLEIRRMYSAKENIRIMLEGLQGESSVAELCRREDINPNMYYKWSKASLEAGKARLTRPTDQFFDQRFTSKEIIRISSLKSTQPFTGVDRLKLISRNHSLTDQ